MEYMLPGKAGGSGPAGRRADDRNFVEAVLRTARAGSPWRDLPEQFRPWNSAYGRQRRRDRQAYKVATSLNAFFRLLKPFRHIVNRHDKLAERYASIVTAGASFICPSIEP